MQFCFKMSKEGKVKRYNLGKKGFSLYLKKIEMIYYVNKSNYRKRGTCDLYKIAFHISTDY